MILPKSAPDCLKIVSGALINGEVVIIPTDTVYGFSGIVPHSADRIRNIKGREENKPFIQLIADPEDLLLYSAQDVPQCIAARMPGALTVIVSSVCSGQAGSGGTTAFRCPDDDWLRSLIRLCGKPLYSTSVNKSGCPVLTDTAVMEKVFGEQVFCIVDGGKNKNAVPSTIVDITGEKPKIIRQGAVYIDVATP